MDTQIFGARAGYNAAKLALQTGDVAIDMSQVEEETARIKRIRGDIRPSHVTKEIQKTMWEDVGIIRSADTLSKALAVLSQWRRDGIPKLSGPSENWHGGIDYPVRC